MNYTIGQLREFLKIRCKFSEIFTNKPGIYKVIYKNNDPIIFKNEKCDLNESYLIDKFEQGNNLDGIIYIGKADDLAKRIRQYIRHGEQYKDNPLKRKPHYGGRYIWHIENINDAEVYFELNNEPRKEEKRLLEEFKKNNGNLPFANLI